MATAYVKNSAITFYQEPDKKTIVSQINRNWSVQPHYLNDFAEGAELGVLTGKEQGEFVQIVYEFDIKIKQFKTGIKQYFWIGNATDVSTWEHHTETLWVKSVDITTESPSTAAAKAAAKKAADKKAQVDKLLSDTGNPNLTANGGNTEKSNNGLLIAGIIAGVGVLGGILIWAFGKNKTATKTAAPLTIIQLSKPKKP